MKLEFILVLTTLVLCDARRPKAGRQGSSDGGSVGGRGLDMRGTLRKGFAVEAASSGNDKSMICSPVSAFLPLGKLALGAEGKCHDELMDASGLRSSFELKDDLKSIIHSLKFLPGVTLDIASRIFVHKTAFLRKSFVREAASVFKSTVEAEDFEDAGEAALRINKWVERETHGKITRMINQDEISSDKSMILLDAVYFSGKWKHPFEGVQIMEFLTPSGVQKMPFMFRYGYYYYGNSSNLDASILEIPYRGGKVSFVIVLPNKPNGLNMVLAALTLAPELLNEALQKMQSGHMRISVPRFKVMTTLNLQPLYEKIGVTKIFDQASGLSKITTNATLHVSSAIQKALIEFDEGGTTDASSYAYLNSMVKGSTFEVNHPFLFVVMADRQEIISGIFLQ